MSEGPLGGPSEVVLSEGCPLTTLVYEGSLAPLGLLHPSSSFISHRIFSGGLLGRRWAGKALCVTPAGGFSGGYNRFRTTGGGEEVSSPLPPPLPPPPTPPS